MISIIRNKRIKGWSYPLEKDDLFEGMDLLDLEIPVHVLYDCDMGNDVISVYYNKEHRFFQIFINCVRSKMKKAINHLLCEEIMPYFYPWIRKQLKEDSLEGRLVCRLINNKLVVGETSYEQIFSVSI